eukprot:Transcript_3738.p1 GENE.Transcript_3738~~Transcript_3738.p1  ORF type:complete len:520 (-),score=263.12 Transcript_3738:132-1628(-)
MIAARIVRSPRATAAARALSTAVRATAAEGPSTALNAPLSETDPELFDIIEHEKRRQRNSLVLIPSENYTSKSVLDALGSVMSNKYSEGYPHARYYGGNEFIDKAEDLCRTRALEAFNADSDKWGVNVQPLSGSPANMYVYSALLKPHDRIMGLDLPHGGHLSHGFQTPTKKISMVSLYFETMPYRLDESTGYIDYDTLEANAQLFRPKLIIAGTSAYSRHIDYPRMRKICDSVGAYLLADMAHISGLVAAGVVPSPFEYADVITTTTHKSLRGPRGAMIFFRKGVRSVTAKGKEVLYDLEGPINQAVFPGHQGGPHNHTISALATALKQANTPEFVTYQKQVLANNARFGEAMVARGYSLVSGGTDNHLLLVDLKPAGIDGARVEAVLERANVALNKNTVPGDKSALIPGGIRVGTPALTSRGLEEAHFDQVAEFIHRGVGIAKEINATAGGKKLADFKAALGAQEHASITALRNDVEAFASQFPCIGFDQETMKYK